MPQLTPSERSRLIGLLGRRMSELDATCEAYAEYASILAKVQEAQAKELDEVDA